MHALLEFVIPVLDEGLRGINDAIAFGLLAQLVGHSLDVFFEEKSRYVTMVEHVVDVD